MSDNQSNSNSDSIYETTVLIGNDAEISAYYLTVEYPRGNPRPTVTLGVFNDINYPRLLNCVDGGRILNGKITTKKANYTINYMGNETYTLKIIDPDSTTLQVYKDSMLNSVNDAPSNIYTKGERLTIKEWHRDGVFHRENNLPACMINCNFSNTPEEIYMVNGNYRENMPGRITYFTRSQMKVLDWYKNNELIKEEKVHVNPILNNPDIAWDWEELSHNSHITEDDLLCNLDKPWNWRVLSVSHPGISIQFILNHPTLPWDWKTVSEHPQLTLKNILDNPDREWCWKTLSRKLDVHISVK